MNKQNLLLEIERYNELQQTFREDVPIFLKNKRSTLSEVAAVEVRENGRSNYMADVVTDDEGKIKEIRFDKIRI